jgi:hypothetical protein
VKLPSEHDTLKTLAAGIGSVLRLGRPTSEERLALIGVRWPAEFQISPTPAMRWSVSGRQPTGRPAQHRGEGTSSLERRSCFLDEKILGEGRAPDRMAAWLNEAEKALRLAREAREWVQGLFPGSRSQASENL